MSRLLVIFSVAMFCLFTLGAASKCDKKIIELIRDKFWNHGRCIPRNLLRTGAFLSSEAVNVTTKDYYPNEKDIACVFSSIQGSVLKIYIQYVNSTSSLEPAYVLNLTEKNGALIEEDKGIYRFHLYANRFGVTAFYKCSKTGEVGAPEGAIKVSARGYDERAFADSVKDMASVGIIVSDKVYSDYCLPQKT